MLALNEFYGRRKGPLIINHSCILDSAISVPVNVHIKLLLAKTDASSEHRPYLHDDGIAKAISMNAYME